MFGPRHVAGTDGAPRIGSRHDCFSLIDIELIPRRRPGQRDTGELGITRSPMAANHLVTRKGIDGGVVVLLDHDYVQRLPGALVDVFEREVDPEPIVIFGEYPERPGDTHRAINFR